MDFFSQIIICLRLSKIKSPQNILLIGVSFSKGKKCSFLVVSQNRVFLTVGWDPREGREQFLKFFF